MRFRVRSFSHEAIGNEAPMDDILEFLYDVLPPWLATVIAGGLGLIAGIIGTVWRSHEQAQIAACSTGQGQFAQLVNGAARTGCGASSLLSKVALVLEVGGFIVMGVFAIVFLVLAAKGKLTRAQTA